MPAGRPSKYDPKFCETVIEVGEQGDTLAAMAEACDIHRETLNEWMKIHPEFSDAVKRGLQKAQVLWERSGLEMALGLKESGNPTTYIFNMKNRFKDDWRDKHDFNHESEDRSMTPVFNTVYEEKPKGD